VTQVLKRSSARNFATYLVEPALRAGGTFNCMIPVQADAPAQLT
jgi:hypothetical protein